MTKQRYVYIVSYDGHIKEVHTRARTARERYKELRNQYAANLISYTDSIDFGEYMKRYNELCDRWRCERWPLNHSKPA